MSVTIVYCVPRGPSCISRSKASNKELATMCHYSLWRCPGIGSRIEKNALR